MNVVPFYRCIGRSTAYIRHVLCVKRCRLNVWLLPEPFVCVRIGVDVSVGVKGIVWPLGFSRGVL
jgi:hypothetical protein